jgi:PPOX class probable F420-dependent enzyme
MDVAQSSTVEELPDWALALLANARVARLGLLDDDLSPRVLPVTFVLHDSALWSAVDEKRKRLRGHALARVRYLKERPRATLTVDHYEEDWSALSWVQAIGNVDVIDVELAPAALHALIAKYDQYRERPPAGPLLHLRPERFVCWHS